MDNLNAMMNAGLARRYEELGAKVRELAVPLSDEQFWRKPFPFGNSFGHLVLHLTGNLSYYIGAQIAQTGYVRDRPREFTESQHPRKEDALKRFEAAVKMVLETIRAQTAEDWLKAYSAVGVNAGTRFEIVLLCATHLHHHIGQMMYLCFELSEREKGSRVGSSR